MTSNYLPQLTFLKQTARAAGEIMRRYYGKDIQVYTKADRSKVTNVDLEISELVQAESARAFPGIELYSEESADGKIIDPARDYFIVDELDGTSYFINEVPGFSHQAAFYDGASRQLAAGLVYYPLDDVLLFAVRGQGAWIEQDGAARPLPPPGPVAFDELRFAHPARFRGDKYWNLFDDLDVEEGRVVMTTALRTMQFLHDQLHVAIFLTPRIPEWDWAGEKVIVEEAGFHHSYLDGRPIRFGEAPPRGNPGYLICPPAHRQRLMADARQHLQP